MRIVKILLVGVLIVNLFGCSNETKEDKFWNWFSQNSDELLSSKSQQNQINERLTDELQKVHPDLVYEMSVVRDGSKVEFTISADGKNELIPVVKALYDRRPNLERWEIKAFRQRNNKIFNFEMNDIKILGNETKYFLVKDKDPQKVSILLFFPNFDEEKRNIFGEAAYIFLDGILGEYDVMTKVGFVEVFGYDSKYFKVAHPIDELVREFDGYFR